MRWLCLSVIFFAFSPSTLAQESLCHENEACGPGQYCACFRNRNQAIGDCDEMGGMCRLTGPGEEVSADMLELWKLQKQAMQVHFGEQP